TVKSREERLKIVGDRCRNCFGTRHKIDECKSQKTCFICNEKHHTSLCNKKRNVTAAAFANETSDHSLLVASVKTNAPQKSVLSEAVALFDTGSNTSFISSQLASRLNLKALTVEPVLINGFGGNTHTEQSRLVKFEIQSEHGPIEILANTIKRIVKDPIEIKSTTGQSSQRNVDILIGLDYFFKFFDVPREVKDDKVVVRSSVGDVILYPKKATKPMKVGLLAINSFSDQERRAWKAEYGDLMPVRTPEDLQTLQ
uniref:Peptidase A2 domain-containing protein n=1 Tax=Panagrellus redivivus TaxID=6233 RepID=A0A7E4VU90_PANRE